jgi:uncharacterized protein (TIGR02996 family)
MLTEDGFLAQLREAPTDDTTRLVYADWLDEQGDSKSAAKAEFLRLTVQLASSKKRDGRKKELRKLLQVLATALDTDWLSVVSRLAIENCLSKRTKAMESRPAGLPRVSFEFLCDRRWEELTPTDDRAIRFCDGCRHNVHYCDTITEARRHVGDGHCIAVDLGVIRRDGDLQLQGLHRLLGRISPAAMLRREEKRMQPDPVSAERERQKREKEEDKETPPSGGT